MPDASGSAMRSQRQKVAKFGRALIVKSRSEKRKNVIARPAREQTFWSTPIPHLQGVSPKAISGDGAKNSPHKKCKGKQKAKLRPASPRPSGGAWRNGSARVKKARISGKKIVLYTTNI